MGYLNSLQRSARIAGAEITVITDEDVYRQGDIVEGQVVVRAGSDDVSAAVIEVQLDEFWVEERVIEGRPRASTESETHEKVELSRALNLEAHQEISCAFKLHLPRNARISLGERSGWILSVTVDVPDAAQDPIAAFELVVQPAEATRVLLRTIEGTLRFSELEKRRSFDPDTEGTMFVFDPPRSLARCIERMWVALSLAERNAGVVGAVGFELVSPSVEAYLSAAPKLPTAAFSVAIDRGRLYKADGTPNSPELATMFRDLIREAIQTSKAE